MEKKEDETDLLKTVWRDDSFHPDNAWKDAVLTRMRAAQRENQTSAAGRLTLPLALLLLLTVNIWAGWTAGRDARKIMRQEHLMAVGSELLVLQE